jgi:hypothetical protein
MGDLGFARFGDCGCVCMAGSRARWTERETYLCCRHSMWPELGDETRRSSKEGQCGCKLACLRVRREVEGTSTTFFYEGRKGVEDLSTKGADDLSTKGAIDLRTGAEWIWERRARSVDLGFEHEGRGMWIWPYP